MIITKENGKSKTISGCPEPRGAHLKRRCGKGPKRKDGSRSRCLREASLGKQGSSKTSVRTRREYGRRYVMARAALRRQTLSRALSVQRINHVHCACVTQVVCCSRGQGAGPAQICTTRTRTVSGSWFSSQTNVQSGFGCLQGLGLD